MKLAFCPGREEQPRAGQLKLRSLFAIMAVIGIYLAWHRQYGHLYEHNESPAFVTIPALGLPLAILLAGIFPRWREPTYAVGMVLIPVLCISCTWTTIHTLMHIPLSVPPLNQYSIYGRQILWSSFLWGFALPAIATIVVVAFETERREFKCNSLALALCIFSLINTTVANLFAILIFTMKVRDIDAFGAWLRQLYGISS